MGHLRCSHRLRVDFLAWRLSARVWEFANRPRIRQPRKFGVEWFPQKRQRSFAFGWVNAGCNMAAIITPLVVRFLALRFGWQAAFVWTGAMGLLLLLFWLPFYRQPEKHSWVSPRESRADSQRSAADFRQIALAKGHSISPVVGVHGGENVHRRDLVVLHDLAAAFSF